MRRLLLVFLVLALLGAALAGLGYLLAGSRGTATPSGPKVLAFALDGGLDDYHPAPPFAFLAERQPLHLAAIWRALASARADDSVRGVAVRLNSAGFGIGKAQELRRQLAETARAGKKVACYLDTVGEGSNGTLEYYLASACPEISLSPAGELNLLGLWADAIFLRGSLDKLKIEPSFLAAGRYKSAAEIFTERAHTPAAREAIEAILDSDFRQIVAGLADARRITPERIRALVDQAPLSARQALDARLVDRVEYPDEFRARLESAAGDDVTWEDLEDYARANAPKRRTDAEIAIVFAQGTIVRGDGGLDPWTREAFLGSEDFGQSLADLGDDDRVRAVVLRVDSPGGSAVASDLMHRRVELLRKKKPVVVSMSDVAASGGYYLAAKASRIVAEPGTLTGSIGVITGKFATGRFEEEVLGATHDPIARGANAGIYSTLRPFGDADRARIAARVADIYDRFLTVVGEGRSMSREQVARVAEGRVWTGEDAAPLGLVDRLGGLDAAVEEARKLAGLGAAEGSIRFYPREQSLWEWLGGAHPPAFGASFARLVALVRTARTPGTLELPAGFLQLARPF
jgi:protease-4